MQRKRPLISMRHFVSRPRTGKVEGNARKRLSGSGKERIWPWYWLRIEFVTWGTQDEDKVLGCRGKMSSVPSREHGGLGPQQRDCV